ncbi:MAG: RNA polymerase sigma factor RpoD/SigA [Saprospiraceae bacterium]|nr:RNA polymerase sigma factor RpoD/SigA [Saprospiraceae bacterium]MDW8484096.1 RNA polymerase sigma factor RpoD/SigA [Saprospiraceae bacterium]
MRQLKIAHKITSRESQALERYLHEISKIPLLTPEQEVALARRIREGDVEALHQLTEANLRFVVSVAKQYQNQGLSLSDLINEGNIGLIKAAHRFDETRGFKFISYAVWWIRQSILQAIVENSRLVRMPMSRVSAYNKVHEAHASFVQTFEREPTAQELADLLDMSVTEVETLLAANNRHLSVDAPLAGSEDSEGTLLDVLRDEDVLNPETDLMVESLREEVALGLAALSPREMEIISAFYGLVGKKALSLDEIAEQFGLSRERVRQIKERALRRLRRVYNRNALRSYLG